MESGEWEGKELQGMTQAREAYRCQSGKFIQEKWVDLFQWNIWMWRGFDWDKVGKVSL